MTSPSLVDTRRADVAVLYVDERGPYPSLVTKWYDAKRNAKTYAGPWPVVAHPPCGPWGRLRHLSKKDTPEQDPTAGPHAVELVRRHGGVLEHPAKSTLFRYCGMPHPGELPDEHGGVTIEVCQVDWGHVARKRTWLYVVGLRGRIPPAPPPREPTHWASGGGTSRGRTPPGIKVCSAQQRRRTPPAFAEWLVELASRCATWRSA